MPTLRGAGAGVLAAAMLLLWSVGTPRAGACMTASMDVPTLADHAGQVIVARVSAARSYWADDPKRIETELTLVETAYLKGAHPGAAGAGGVFTLVVPGGTVGERSSRVCCGPIPAVGERWLLFLLPSYKTYPTVGLAQGAMRIEEDAGGVPRVFTAGGRAIEGIDDDGSLRIAPSRRDEKDRLGGALVGEHGVSVRRRTAEGRADDAELRAQGASLEAFTAQLEPVLRASVDHGMTGPAGRSAVAPLRVVAPGEAAAVDDRPGVTRSGVGRPERVERARERSGGDEPGGER